MSPVAIHSTRVILPADIKDATVVISDGLISEIIPGMPLGLSIDLIDLGASALMAGIIDPHVHINEPGHTDWEGFDTATRAAASGGITTLVDMPLNSLPVTTTALAFDEKLNATLGKLHINIGFWGGIIPGNSNEIESLIDKGVLGFKAFLIHSGIDEFPNVTAPDLREAMPLIAKHQLPVLVHCELNAENTIADIDNHHSYTDYLASRPQRWEDDAIALMIRLCKEFNCPTHIVHLSSATAVGQIVKAKQQ
jgi:allantoinase